MTATRKKGEYQPWKRADKVYEWLKEREKTLRPNSETQKFLALYNLVEDALKDAALADVRGHLPEMRWLDLHGGIPDGHNWSVAMGPQKPAVAFGDSVAPCLCVELKKKGGLPSSGTAIA